MPAAASAARFGNQVPAGYPAISAKRRPSGWAAGYWVITPSRLTSPRHAVHRTIVITVPQGSTQWLSR